MRITTLSQIVCFAGVLCHAGLAAGSSVMADGSGVAGASQPIVVSIPAYLQMQRPQVDQLSRLYEGYAGRRSVQEVKIVRWQDKLAGSGAPDRLRRPVEDARHQVVSDLLDTRGKALKALTPVQRAQLDSLRSDSRFQLRRDRYYELLVMPADELWRSPTPDASGVRAPAQARHDARVGYGVYGGYGYHEPQYGVYGSYGQGSVGVQVGVGRGGPSIGVGLGGILGGRHR